MLTHPHFKVPMPDPQWPYFNAFLGSQNACLGFRKEWPHASVIEEIRECMQVIDI